MIWQFLRQAAAFYKLRLLKIQRKKLSHKMTEFH